MTDPAEKYRDKVSPEHTMLMNTIGFAYQLMEAQRQQLRLFLDAERSAHAVGHIIDPTLYRDMINSESFAQQLVLCRAAEAFLAACDEVKAKTMPPIGGRP